SGTGALSKLAGEKGAPALVNGLLGEGLQLAGDTERAKKVFASSLEGNPLAYRANARLADLALAAGKPADAEAAARASLSMAPGYVPAHSALGRALVATAKQSEAGPELQIVVETGRGTAVEELAFAVAKLAMGDPEAAKAAVRRARDKGAVPAQL